MLSGKGLIICMINTLIGATIGNLTWALNCPVSRLASMINIFSFSSFLVRTSFRDHRYWRLQHTALLYNRPPAPPLIHASWNPMAALPRLETDSHPFLTTTTKHNHHRHHRQKLTMTSFLVVPTADSVRLISEGGGALGTAMASLDSRLEVEAVARATQLIHGQRFEVRTHCSNSCYKAGWGGGEEGMEWGRVLIPALNLGIMSSAVPDLRLGLCARVRIQDEYTRHKGRRARLKLARTCESISHTRALHTIPLALPYERTRRITTRVPTHPTQLIPTPQAFDGVCDEGRDPSNTTASQGAQGGVQRRVLAGTRDGARGLLGSRAEDHPLVSELHCDLGTDCNDCGPWVGTIPDVW